MAHGACDDCGCARGECDTPYERAARLDLVVVRREDMERINAQQFAKLRPQAELDREEAERRGYPPGLDYEALVLAEADDIE